MSGSLCGHILLEIGVDDWFGGTVSVFLLPIDTIKYNQISIFWKDLLNEALLVFSL